MNAIIYPLIALAWGSGFLFIKIMVEKVPPFTSAFLRMMFALLFLFPVYKIFGKKTTLLKGSHLQVWTAGLFMFGFPFVFLFWGGKFVSPGITGVLQGMITIWTLIIGAIFLPRQEAFGRWKLLGVILSFLGLAIIFSPKIKLQENSEELLGLGAVISATICYGIAAILNRSLFSKYRHLDLYANLFHQLSSGAFLLLLISITTEPFSTFSEIFTNPGLLGAALFLGIPSTGLAYLGLYHLIRSWGSVKAISVSYLVPLVALLTDYFYYGRSPGLNEITGVGGILLGVFIIHIKG